MARTWRRNDDDAARKNKYADTHIFLMDHTVLHRRFISDTFAHSSRNPPLCNFLALVHGETTRTEVDEEE